jgi:hypothetical protein
MGDNKINVLVSVEDFFSDLVQEAIVARKMSTFPLAQNYLVSILGSYIHTNNLYDTHTEDGKLTRDTLAETFLRAQSANGTTKIELLKKLGDVSLYVSGFFADSLSRKIVDVDYYVDMGEAAYGALAQEIKEDTSRKVFKDFSTRFLEYVDIFETISQKSLAQNDGNILRLYEKYLKTGSELARETLEEKGIVTIPFDKDKKSFAQ